jgi:preprotein translocase subunit SecE
MIGVISPAGFFTYRIFMKLLAYLNNTRMEMKQVVWPSRNQVIIFTVLTIVIAVIVAYYLGLFDAIFTQLLGLLINQ